MITKRTLTCGRAGFISSLFMAAALSACSTPARVERVYVDSLVTEPFVDILVVGVHENGNVRGRYERIVASALQDAGAQASSSLSFMRTTDEISRDTLLAAAREAGADAVMISRLLSVEGRREVEEGIISVDVTRRANIPIADFFRYEYTEYQDPLVVTTVRTVALATELYSVATENRVWSVESTSFDKASSDEILFDLARAVSRALARDGLIR